MFHAESCHFITKFPELIGNQWNVPKMFLKTFNSNSLYCLNLLKKQYSTRSYRRQKILFSTFVNFTASFWRYHFYLLEVNALSTWKGQRSVVNQDNNWILSCNTSSGGRKNPLQTPKRLSTQTRLVNSFKSSQFEIIVHKNDKQKLINNTESFHKLKLFL